MTTCSLALGRRRHHQQRAGRSINEEEGDGLQNVVQRVVIEVAWMKRYVGLLEPRRENAYQQSCRSQRHTRHSSAQIGTDESHAEKHMSDHIIKNGEAEFGVPEQNCTYVKSEHSYRGKYQESRCP